MRHRLVGLMTPLGWLRINLRNLVASIHKRSTGLALRLNPTRSERLHSQLCEVFRKESSISLRKVLELIVVILPILCRVCATRWVSCSIRDKGSREVKVLLERRRRQWPNADTRVLVFRRFEYGGETAMSKSSQGCHFSVLEGSDSSRR